MAEGGPWGFSLPHVPEPRQLPGRGSESEQLRSTCQDQQARALSTEAGARTQGGLGDGTQQQRAKGAAVPSKAMIFDVESSFTNSGS